MDFVKCLAMFEFRIDGIELCKIAVLIEPRNFATSAKHLAYVWLDTLVEDTVFMHFQQMILLMVFSTKTVLTDVVTNLMSRILHMICLHASKEGSTEDLPTIPYGTSFRFEHRISIV